MYPTIQKIEVTNSNLNYINIENDNNIIKNDSDNNNDNDNMYNNKNELKIQHITVLNMESDPSLEDNFLIINENLLEINFSHNKINILPNNLLYKFPSLVTIDLSFNNIKEINENNFDISHNPIHLIEGNTFKSPSLYYLNLSHTNITNLDYNTFWFTPRILILDLSYNNLKKFDGHSLYPIQNLLTLYLDGNNLTEIDYEDSRIIRDRLDIGLTDNNWNCTFLKNMIKYLNEKYIKYLLPNNHLPIGDKNIAGIGCWEKSHETKKNKNPYSINEKFTSNLEKHITYYSEDNNYNQSLLLNLMKEQERTNILLIAITTCISVISLIIIVDIIKRNFCNKNVRYSSKHFRVENVPFVDRQTFNL
ncbi:homeobox protein 3-like [Condylostylus longicornis]|uniref:homeobox protein 3-like n=1 Tax=Condylostylus longicornis TaxID=2530218 RepID=UPI00244E54B9|nr:homeobox protein 3-like [Condylostylus longicornis]